VSAVLFTSSAWAAPAGGAFEQLVDDFVFGTLALSPTTATGVGYHEHHGASLEDTLDDFSPAGIAASRSLVGDIRTRIAHLDGGSLDAEQRADVDIMRDALAATRLELEDIQSYRHIDDLRGAAGQRLIFALCAAVRAGRGKVPAHHQPI